VIDGLIGGKLYGKLLQRVRNSGKRYMTATVTATGTKYAEILHLVSSLLDPTGPTGLLRYLASGHRLGFNHADKISRSAATNSGSCTASATSETMMKTRDQYLGEIRYAIRLCQRTARLYRRIQGAGIFFSIVGGSAAFTGIQGNLPAWIPAAGGVLLAIAGAALISIRPADKASQNEADVKRYQALMAKAHGIDDADLAAAIEEAHQGDAPEVEPLRNVAYNDVVMEINRADQEISLTATERLLKVLA